MREFGRTHFLYVARHRSQKLRSLDVTIQKETIAIFQHDSQNELGLLGGPRPFRDLTISRASVSLVFALWRPLSLMHKPRSLSWDIFTGLLRPPENFKMNVIMFLVYVLMMMVPLRLQAHTPRRRRFPAPKARARP